MQSRPATSRFTEAAGALALALEDFQGVPARDGWKSLVDRSPGQSAPGLAKEGCVRSPFGPGSKRSRERAETCSVD